LPAVAEPKTNVAKTATTAALQLVRRACLAMVFLLVARELGPADYGALAALVAMSAMLSPFSGLGVDFSALRMVAQNPNSAGAVLAAAVRRILWSGSGLLLLGWAALFFWSPKGVSPWVFGLLLAAEVLPLKLTELVAKMEQGLGQLVRMGLVRLYPTLSRLLAAGVLVTFPWSEDIDRLGVWAALYFGAGALAALTALALFKSKRVIRNFGFRPLPFREGISFALGLVGFRLLTEADKVVVFLLGDSAEGAGSYAVAYRLVELLLIPLAAGLAVIQGRQLALAGRGEKVRLLADSRRPLMWILLSSIVLGLALGSSGALLAKGVLGQGFSVIAEIAGPMSLMPLAIGLRMYFDQMAVSLGLLGPRLLVVWCMGALALTLNCLFVPNYGWTVVAWVCVMCESTTAASLAVVSFMHVRGASGRFAT